MDSEARQRRESIRIIASEIIMVLTVAIMVVILAFLVSGYWISSDFTVERQGMLQISSIPTGASVDVDGDSPWFQRTNTSKVLASGEHTVTLTKDGYDSWSKTINIREGLLYRLHYPRLFLESRERETIGSFPAATFATISPSHKWLILANETTAWQLINLDRDKPEPVTLDISKIFNSVSLASEATTGLFIGEILSVQWAGDNEHVLFEVQSGDNTEWVLLNIRTIDNSINITRDILSSYNDLQIFDSSASKLLALRDSNLYVIDVASRQLPATPLAENVISYTYYDDEIIFVSEPTVATSNVMGSVPESADSVSVTTGKYYIGLTHSGDSEPTVVAFFNELPRAYISQFYDNKYITVITGSQLAVHRKDAYDEEIFTGTVSFTPEHIKVGHDGEFVFLAAGSTFATLDMESLAITEWFAGTTNYAWLDNDMLYVVDDGTLSVYDYDGLNHRTLAKNVSDHFPVTITADKWLYYFSDNHLVREWLVKR